MTTTRRPTCSPEPAARAVQYGSRTPATSRAPSGGVLSRPIAGMGKLGCGQHQLTVLSVVDAPTHRVLILANSANHCHAETVEWLPDWVVRGLDVRATIGFTDGFVVCRDVDRYQARNARDLTPLTDWLDSAQAVYEGCTVAGYAPASTKLEELRADGDRVFVPTIYRAPSSGTPGTPKTGGAGR